MIEFDSMKSSQNIGSKANLQQCSVEFDLIMKTMTNWFLELRS